MSGLEITGVVLGLVPIITGGIELWKTKLTIREIRQLERSFKTQRNIFMNTIEEILSPLASDTQLKQLLDHPDGEAWKDTRLSSKLEEHMGESYQSFKEILEDVQGMLTDLRRILIDVSCFLIGRSDHKLMRMDAQDPKRRHVLKRVKQFISRARGEAGLTRLSARIAELETLQSQSLRLAPTRQFKGGMEAYGKVRECAQKLHDALSRGWQCDCKAPHLANLRLEARKPPRANAGKGSSSDDEFRFKFLFSFAAEENKGGQPLDWREAELGPLEDDDSSSTSANQRQTIQTLPGSPKDPGGSVGPVLRPWEYVIRHAVLPPSADSPCLVPPTPPPPPHRVPLKTRMLASSSRTQNRHHRHHTNKGKEGTQTWVMTRRSKTSVDGLRISRRLNHLTENV